jgi:glycosyltransferase involved in cell wall biosynthesis
MQALGVPARQVRILPNAVEDPPPQPPSGRSAQLLLRVSNDAPLILFLGRLQAIKGPDLLLTAFAETVRSVPAAHLVLAGPDEGMSVRLREQAQQLGVAARVSFAGPVAGQDKEALYAAADVVALPSRSEGQSMTLLEALIRGKSVVCTETCVFDPAIRRFAQVVAAEPQAIAAGLVQSLTTVEDGRKAALCGREFVAQNYSVARVAAVAERIYVDATGHSPES